MKSENDVISGLHCFMPGKALRKTARAYREEIAYCGQTHGQFFLIVAIIEAEGLLPSELAEKTAQDRPTITGLLDRTISSGMLVRTNSPTCSSSARWK